MKPRLSSLLNVFKVSFTLFVLVMCLNGKASAGQIDTIIMSPSSPGPTDTIWFYVHCTLPTSGCPHEAITSGVNGNMISASTIHCLGMLTSLCGSIDTVVVNPLHTTGKYKFVFTLNSGYGSIPCTPGFTYDDVDTLNFTIGTDGIQEINNRAMQLYPNPACDNLSIKLPNTAPEGLYTAIFFDALGRKVLTREFEKNAGHLPIGLSAGSYFIEVRSRSKDLYFNSFLIVSKPGM